MSKRVSRWRPAGLIVPHWASRSQNSQDGHNHEWAKRERNATEILWFTLFTKITALQGRFVLSSPSTGIGGQHRASIYIFLVKSVILVNLSYFEWLDVVSAVEALWASCEFCDWHPSVLHPLCLCPCAQGLCRYKLYF